MSRGDSLAVERVLLVHDYAGVRGGAELVIQDMRAALRRRGIDARLMASDADPFDQASAPDFPFRGSTGRARALRETINPDAVRVARRVLRQFSPQIVHLGMFLTQASPAVLPVFRGHPTVWVPNEYRATCPKGTRLLPDGTPCRHTPGRACLREGCLRPWGLVPRLVQLGLLRRWRSAVDVVVTPSRAVAAEFAQQGLHVDDVVPHAVPGDIPPRGAVTPFLVGFAGRLMPEKGVEVLLDAIALLPPGLQHVRLLLVGDGPDRLRLEHRTTSLGLGDRVEFVGHVSREEVQRRLSPVAVQVVPSLWAEPFGLVTVEAMARGTPVVMTSLGAAPELIEDGCTGFLVPPADPAALARCLARILTEPERLAAVGSAARQKALEHFTMDGVIERFIGIYTALLRDRQGGS